jgi:hypothetical protein
MLRVVRLLTGVVTILFLSCCIFRHTFCAWDTRSASVAARVEMALSILVVGRVLSSVCSLACTDASSSMCICGCPCDVVGFANICV